MKLVVKIAAGVLLAVVLIVVVLAVGRASHQEDDFNQQQAEFCKKAVNQGMSDAELKKVGCKK